MRRVYRPQILPASNLDAQPLNALVLKKGTHPQMATTSPHDRAKEHSQTRGEVIITAFGSSAANTGAG